MVDGVSALDQRFETDETRHSAGGNMSMGLALVKPHSSRSNQNGPDNRSCFLEAGSLSSPQSASVIKI
jgi:hypothetical protein